MKLFLGHAADIQTDSVCVLGGVGGGVTATIGRSGMRDLRY